MPADRMLLAGASKYILRKDYCRLLSHSFLAEELGVLPPAGGLGGSLHNPPSPPWKGGTGSSFLAYETVI